MKLSKQLRQDHECGDFGRALEGYAEQAEKLEVALERIAKWFGEFPPSGCYWDEEKTKEMSYGAAFGSMSERDYMRALARKALED